MVSDIELLEACEARMDRGELLNVSRQDRYRLAEAVLTSTYLYFLIAPDSMLIKIAKGRDVKKSLRTVQTQSPVEIRLMGAVRVHQDIQDRLQSLFAATRSHGDWFHATEDLLDVIQAGTEQGFRTMMLRMQSLKHKRLTTRINR